MKCLARTALGPKPVDLATHQGHPKKADSTPETSYANITHERVCLAAFLMVLPATSPTAETGRPRPPSIPIPNRAPQGAPVRLDGNYGNLPSAFEPNLGQTAPEVRFLTRSRGMIVFFTDTEAVMVLHQSEKRRQVVRMKLAGAMKPRQAAGLEKLPGVSNYFIGNDPKKWRTDVPHYARIRYEGVYPGIDLVWYGNQRQLEYDFVVAPGADPKQIQVAYEGVESVGVEAGGELVLRTALGEVRQQPPRVYQEIGGKRVEVGARYAMVARNRVSFELAQLRPEAGVAHRPGGAGLLHLPGWKRR